MCMDFNNHIMGCLPTTSNGSIGEWKTSARIIEFYERLLGYRKIRMHPVDEAHTDATYQTIINELFKDMMGWNTDAYIYNILSQIR